MSQRRSSPPRRSVEAIDEADLLELHRRVVEGVPDYAIFVVDRAGLIRTWNAGARRMLGYEKKEVVGTAESAFYTREDASAGVPGSELRDAERGESVEHMGWRLRKGGDRFWTHGTTTAIRDERGGVLGFARFLRDLTEEERALRESEERFRTLVMGLKDYAVFMLDATGHIISWNEGAQRIKGYTAREILGHHFSIFYPPVDIQSQKPAMELEVAKAAGSFEDEGWRIRRDGSRFWANVIITAMRTAAGELLGFSKVTRDLTERRAAEERATEDAVRLARAEAANQAKDEFLAAMSHELRTPLNAIAGYTDLLAAGIGGDLTEQQSSYLRRIQLSQQHLLSIINDLLNYTRLEAGQVVYDLGPVSLSEVMTGVIAMIEPQASARALVIEREGNGVLTVLADRAKVEQVVLNLLSNSVKFTPPGGRILIGEFIQDERTGGIRVSDTGVGIPADKLESIFEPFVQVGRSLVSPHEGTGLGLAISRDLARAMRGDLTVSSTVGVGSTFRLSLPLA